VQYQIGRWFVPWRVAVNRAASSDQIIVSCFLPFPRSRCDESLRVCQVLFAPELGFSLLAVVDVEVDPIQ